MSLSRRGTTFAKVLAIAGAGSILAMFGLVYAIDQNNRFGEVPCTETDGKASTDSSALAQWVGYSSLKEMVGNADAIVVAKVDGCVKVYSHPKSKDLRLTNFGFVVEDSMKGTFSEGERVTVDFLSSGLDSERHLMKADERYVLFLAFNQITESYFPVGGPQGRFQVIDDQVYSLDNYYADLDFINVKVDGEPLGHFVSRIRTMTG
jgi:hypothetical protein